jgi:hypothetical protein
MDYFDILLAKKLSGGGGGDINVESLTATENGTYNAGTGKAYNPVVVAVPEPTLIAKSISQNGTYNASDDNADGYSSVTVDVEGYQIKNIPNEPADIASFNDGTDLPMLKLEVGIEAVQDLHGYDNPWPAGGGKNKFAYDTISFTKSKSYPCELGAGTYTLSALVTSTDTDDTRCLFVVCDSDNQSLANGRLDRDTRGSATFTITEQADNIIFYASDSNVHSIDDTATWTNVQIELGSTETSYAPYSNICPISGWSSVGVTDCAVNIWDEQTEGGTYNNTTGEPQNASTLTRCKNFIKVNPSESYYLVIGSTSALNILQYGKNKEYLGTSTLIQNNASRGFSVTANTYYIRFYFVGTTYNNDISINYPSTDTTYHAYNGHTYTIDLDGTRYGGKVDLVSGVMTVDRVGIKTSDLNWVYQTTGERFHTSDLVDTIVKPKSNINILNGFGCEYLKVASALDVFTYGMSIGVASSGNIFLKNTDWDTAEELLGAVGDKYIVYPLATPLTIQLPPTVVKSLEGVNNISADSGDVLGGKYFSEL